MVRKLLLWLFLGIFSKIFCFENMSAKIFTTLWVSYVGEILDSLLEAVRRVKSSSSRLCDVEWIHTVEHPSTLQISRAIGCTRGHGQHRRQRGDERYQQTSAWAPRPRHRAPLAPLVRHLQHLRAQQVLGLRGGLRGQGVPLPQEHPGRQVNRLRRDVHPRHGGEQEEQGGHCWPWRRHCARHGQIHLLWKGMF